MRKLLAVFLLTVLATPAFAAVQNVKVSGDIDSYYVNRNHFDLGLKNGAGSHGTGVDAGLSAQSVFTTATRLRVDADLSDNVSTTVRLLNQLAWGKGEGQGSGTSNNVTLDLANVTLREFLYSPLTLTVGRQEFFYGNGLILGGGPDVPTTGGLNGIAADLDKQAAQDGVKAVLDYKPLTVDLLFIKNSSGNVTGAIDTSAKDESNVYGANLNYQLGDSANTVLEGYFFSKVTKDAGGSSSATKKGDVVNVPGLRASTNPVKGLNVQGEVAWQMGNKVVNSGNERSEQRRAMLLNLMTSYALPVAELEKYKPTVSASYTRVSGDKNGGVNYDSDTVKSAKYYTAWDPIFEAQGAGTIYNALFNFTNMNIISAGASVNPIEDVTTSFTWSHLRADKEYRTGNTLSLLRPESTSTLSPATTGNKELGNEYDVNLNYAYTEDVTFGLNLGWFVPGDAFSTANDNTASQAIGHVNVAF